MGDDEIMCKCSKEDTRLIRTSLKVVKNVDNAALSVYRWL